MNLGKFEGVVVAKWLQHSGNDRDMELLEDFVYVDPDGKRWLAPSGSVVNGASIPEPLWNIIGSPFVGDYRRASVIHDVACVEKEEPHKAVHLMFYHAMRADQVGWVQANIMYQAVKRFGPRWNIAERDISVGVSSVNNSNIFEWVNAVEKAAKQINQSQGLEAVEERAKVLLSQRKAEVAEDTPKAATSKDGQRVSKVRVINRDTDEPSSLQGIFHSMSTTIPLPVRNHFIGHKSLHDLRQQAGIDRSEELPAASSARESKDLSLQGAAGVDELEETLHLRLSREERVQMLDQAMLLLADNYVHLPLKEAMYAVNPTQSLRLFREQTLQTETELISTVQFQLSFKRNCVRQASFNAFLNAVSRRVDKVIQELQYELVSCISNWKVFVENLEQAFGFPVFGICFELKEFLKRLNLYFQEIREVDKVFTR